MKKPKIPYPLPEEVKNKFLNELGVTPTDIDACWEWPRCSDVGDPYFCCNATIYSAAQISYMCFKGEIPNGQKVAHTCNKRFCVNPKHLILGQPRATNDFNLRPRFFEKTKRESFVRSGQTIACLNWIGTVNRQGYGIVYIKRKRKRATHIAIFLSTGKEVPIGKNALHACDNPACVEHSHLRIGTTNENIQDRVDRNRTATGDRHGTHTRPETIRRGANHGMAKFKEQDAVQIRRTFAAYPGKRGVTAALSKYFDSSRYAIDCIVKNETWVHILGSDHPEVQPLPLEELQKHFKKWPAGDAHKLTKISDLQVREIRFLAKQHLGHKGVFPALSKRYNVSQSLVRRIYLRKNRKSVSDNFHELGALPPLFPEGGVQ
jgi:HNH endonuclease